MTTAHQILSKLRKAGAKVTLAGDRLRLEAPKGVLTDELKQYLAPQKAEIIRLLQAEIGTMPTDGPPYPNREGLVKCFYCVHLEMKILHQTFGGTRAKCLIDGQHRTGIALLAKCPHFRCSTIH